MNLSIIHFNVKVDIMPIKMLKGPTRAEDDHEDGLVLSKNVGNSSFQVATLVNAIAGNGLYTLLYVKYVAIISTFFPLNKFVIFLFSLYLLFS